MTIKRLEYMLQEELLRLNSKDLLRFFSKSRIDIDSEKGIVKKAGRSLKLDDMVYLDGHQGIWKVKEFVFEAQLRKEDMVVGFDYEILPRGEDKIFKFKLDEMDLELDHFHFSAQEKRVQDVAGSFNRLPPIYPGGKGRIDPSSVVFESLAKSHEIPQMEIISYDDVVGDKKNPMKYRLDITDSHIIVAAG